VGRGEAKRKGMGEEGRIQSNTDTRRYSRGACGRESCSKQVASLQLAIDQVYSAESK
jgi:hypothetical protein